MSNPIESRPAGCAGCKAGVDRRTFLSAATLAAVAAALDGCMSLTGPGGSFSGTYGGPFTVAVASFAALGTVGGVARVDSGSGAPTALYRSGPSSFVALALICTHQGYYPLEITSSGFYCPNHGSTFSRAGAYTGGRATSALQQFSASYDATAGTVTINRPS
ncbi:MAG: ubiquinol-cytochrome c reductase iron-sulfur subunit [Gemmatimonadales bacterium]